MLVTCSRREATEDLQRLPGRESRDPDPRPTLSSDLMTGVDGPLRFCFLGLTHISRSVLGENSIGHRSGITDKLSFLGTEVPFLWVLHFVSLRFGLDLEALLGIM